MENLLGIVAPVGYHWLINRELVGFGPFTQLQPWHYMHLENCFWATDRWGGVTERRLFVFARRQDCDDLSCFIVGENGSVEGISVIHGWTSTGFEIVREFPNFWEWLKYVVQDIADWASLDAKI